ELLDRSLRSLYSSSDGVRGLGAAVKNLSHRASRNVASAWLIPRHSGTAQLGARGRSIRRDGESFHSPSLSARRDFSQQPGGARHGPPCNCKLFATRLCRCRRIVSMAVSSVPEGRSSSSPGHAETGWRHSRSTPSLSEVFGS